ncbi:hypothetical protein JB92DRAFT_3093505 [Gautieria morchelliformis]|nr:hypothetical protein JB92DRAFT_3093505 [Gautieria morchelliformis]
MSAFHQECGQPFVEKYIDPSYAYYLPFPGEMDDLGLFPLQEASTSAVDNTAPDYYGASHVSGHLLLPTGNLDAPPWPFEDAFEQGSRSGAQPSPTVLARGTQLLPTEQQCHACQTHLVGGQLYCDPLNYGAVETAMSAGGAIHPYDELMTEPNVPVHTYMPFAINCT